MDFIKVKITGEGLKILPVSFDDSRSILGELSIEVAEFMNFDPSAGICHIWHFIEKSRDSMKNGKLFHGSVFDLVTGEFLGGVGLIGMDQKNPALAIWLKKSIQGQGYGFLVIKIFIEWIFENFSFDDLLYSAAKVNSPSIAIAKKLGGVRQGGRRKKTTDGRVFEIVDFLIPRVLF